ncbi:basement membrane-specific heparan sulfate proteoglycan core protein isoform X3 [Solenopsis invicta]|uniref:basement membrane-specific heparan sulfate proteoglycan core protein isoform X3 n=1 Tax=Solenopsis invicta TaxID=13686 RepID=UPI00193E8EA8|nr:basement membrane-specific heparan sulfate proteoglycan core protein isoform X3 [Solenopsis invicta]
MLRILIVVTCFEISTLANAQSKGTTSFDNDTNSDEPEHPIPVESIQGVAGQRTILPCNIQPRESNDAVSMVLWFKEDSGEPLYSYDARSRQFGKAKLWSAAHFWGHRASFRASPPAQLTLQDLRQSDEGVYRCRVDFRNSPTRNLKVNLTVIVPPTKPIIYDAKRRDMSKLLEAYPEGADLFLVCEVHGGKPRPQVSWYLESQNIHASTEVRETPGPGGETNVVTISNVTVKALTRRHHHAKLSCRANNTQLAPPPTTTVVIELNMKPLKVEILGKDQILSAGKTYDVKCQSSGSRPPAALTWWKSSKQLKGQKKNDGVSLQFTPTVEDEGKFLVCRAENPKLPEAGIEDRWKLRVHFAPIASLKIGSTLNPKNIKEGSDVYFECNVRANPRSYKLTWFHEKVELHHNVTGGVVLSDHSLVLQSITRESAGGYTCMAANVEGRAKSNVVNLEVMCRPYPLQNCTTYNTNGSWVRISCVEGYDGGLPQKFVAMVGKRRLESSLPFWEFPMLKPAKVALYAVNAKGSSEPYNIEVVLKGVAKFTGESTSSTDMSPILIGLGGTATGLGLIVTGVLMALWRRHAATPAKPKPPQQPSIATFAGKGEEEDGNPDLIPTTALTNHLTDRKLPRYGSLPRRPRQLEGREMSHDVLEDSDYPRASPNTFYSLQRPHSESISRSIQESCI